MSLLMTHVCQYTGPGSVPVLLRDHREVCCHDISFIDPVAARHYETAHPGAVALSAQSPGTLASELESRGRPSRR